MAEVNEVFLFPSEPIMTFGHLYVYEKDKKKSG